MELGVNVDHVATVRQARRTDEPDPVAAAAMAELGGADSIICHLREDRRHIQDRDLEILRKTVKIPLNLEMAAADEIVQIALRAKPDKVTLVPERRQEVTTEGGLDVVKHQKALREAVRKFHAEKILVSMFIDADAEQVQASRDIGADIFEIHTGHYANARGEKERAHEIDRVATAARLGRELKFKLVAAGHGLTYRNVASIARVPEVEELNIGHSIISRAVFVGIQKAVAEMKELMLRSRSALER